MKIIRSAPEKPGTEVEKIVTRVTTRIVAVLIAGILALVASIGTGVAAADGGAQTNLAINATRESVDQFADENHLTRVPFVILSGDMIALSACGYFAWSNLAYYYCSKDDTVYIGVDEGVWLNEGTSPLAASLLIAHEWAHHLQYVVSHNGASSTVKEDGADCVGGAWLRWFSDREGLNLNINDVRGFWDLAGKIGKADPEDVHGTQLERSTAMATGYFGGLRTCSVVYTRLFQ